MKTPNIEEHQSIELFTKEYGNDIMSRYKKFQEEVKELDEVYHEYFDAYDKSPEVYKHLLDEFSDVQGTFTHLASLFGLYQFEMLHYCMDKVIGRKTDPNYKRFDSTDVTPGSFQRYIPVNRIPFNSNDLEYRDEIENINGRVLVFEGKENGYKLVTNNINEFLPLEDIKVEWKKV